jgi:hypothetical protein
VEKESGLTLSGIYPFKITKKEEEVINNKINEFFMK